MQREREGKGRLVALSSSGTSGFLVCEEKRATAHESRRACTRQYCADEQQ